MASLVRRATLTDLGEIAAIHREAFPRQQDSETWVSATLSASPRLLAFVFAVEERVVGYIFWAQKSGIRPFATLELDQIAVLEQWRRQGCGEHLIRESLSLVSAELKGNQQSLKSVLVSTRADNDARNFYAKVLGARVVAEIDGLYSATEVLMLSERADA